jgi:hypothetical protein
MKATHKSELEGAQEKWNAELNAYKDNLANDKDGALKAL